MAVKENHGIDLGRFYRYIIAAAAVWTIMIIVSFIWNMYHEKRQSIELAKQDTITNFNKDLAFRLWVVGHGGIYVPVTNDSLISPYLGHLPERDVVTVLGRKLTLVSPGMVMKRLTENYSAEYGVRGQIVGLNPLNPANMPDNWERKALMEFKKGRKEVFEIDSSTGEKYMRLIRPLVVGKACLKCHADQGFTIGDISGGISVSVPMKRYFQIADRKIAGILISHGIFWLFGLLCIGLVTLLSRKHLIEKKLSELEIIRINRELDQRVKDRTQELEKKSHDLGARVKELNCLYNVFRLIETSGPSLDKLYQGIIDLIPPSWQYPEITCARLTVEAREFRTRNFAVSQWCQARNIRVRGNIIGIIEVYYSERKPDCFEGPFLKEERNLLNTICERLEKTIAYMELDEELKLALKFNMKIIEESPVGIVIYDKDGNCIKANNASGKLMGAVDETGMHGQNYHHIASWKTTGLYDVALAALREKKTRQMEVSTRSSFGKDVQIDCYLVPLDKGQLLIMANDISTHKKAEEQLVAAKRKAEAASQMKSRFLAGMSHELRTPLNAIIGYSEILEEQFFGDLNEKQIQYVKRIYGSGNLLLSLINDILDLSKIEAGMMDMEYSRISVKSAIESSLVMIRERAYKHNIALELEIPESLENFYIMVDERRLKQILYNLLSNAVKFTPDNGRIILEVTRQGEDLLVSIQDTGVGIDQDVITHIFDEFYQVKNGLTDKTPGTGLGLSLVRKMVERHGGKVWAESEGKNKGSCFRFSLPVDPAGMMGRGGSVPDAAYTASIPPKRVDLTGTKILIADDNPQNLKMMAEFFQTTGCETVVAMDGGKAVELALSDKPDLILMDIQMPVMDGLEATRKIKADSLTRSIPIIALTAFALPEDRDAIIQAGCDDYVSKPVNLKNLGKKVKARLSGDAV